MSVPAYKYTLWSEHSDVPTEYWMCITQVRVKDLQLNKKQPKEGGIHIAGIHIRDELSNWKSMGFRTFLTFVMGSNWVVAVFVMLKEYSGSSWGHMVWLKIWCFWCFCGTGPILCFFFRYGGNLWESLSPLWCSDFSWSLRIICCSGNDGLRTILFSLPRTFSKGNADILSRQPNLLASSAKWTKPWTLYTNMFRP